MSFVVLWGYKSSCCEGFGGGEGVVHSQMNVPCAVGTLACAVEDMVFAGFLGEIPLIYFVDALCHCEGIENRVVSISETAGYVSAGHRGIEPRSQGCCRMCIAMCGAINPDFSNAGFNMWLSLFAGRPAAAAVGLPLYGMIPGGSYLKTLIHTSKKHDDFSRFPPGIIDVLLWRIPQYRHGACGVTPVRTCGRDGTLLCRCTLTGFLWVITGRGGEAAARFICIRLRKFTAGDLCRPCIEA